MIISFLTSMIIIALVALLSGSFSFLSENETNLLYVKEDGDQELFYRTKSSSPEVEESDSGKSEYDDLEDVGNLADITTLDEKPKESKLEPSTDSLPHPMPSTGMGMRSRGRFTPSTDSNNTPPPISNTATSGFSNRRSSNFARPGMTTHMSSDTISDDERTYQPRTPSRRTPSRRAGSNFSGRHGNGNMNGNLNENQYLDKTVEKNASNMLDSIYKENRK